MDEARKRQIIREWKFRKPDYGVISFRCAAVRGDGSVSGL